MNFNDLKLTKPILRSLSELGYETPTPIQREAIPPALKGRDVLGCARTGTGKTCAFALPILIRLDRNRTKAHPIRALVLTPTRELAIQNDQCFADYGKYLPLRSAVIFGGVGQAPQVEALERGVDILVATPGRLADLYQQGHIDLKALEIFVLDEADRMLDMGFIHDVKKILKWLPENKQTLFFSATMPPEVQSLVDQLLRDPVRIAVDPVNSTVDAIDQRLYRTDKSKKIKLLTWLLKEQDYPSVLVFTRTKHGANRVARDLERSGISAAAIHGNKSQTARQTALAQFKEGSLRVLVATDIAARGLDIDGLACVVNYNLPDVPETYVHRIGRTGRAGQAGLALSFCDASERDELRAIEKQLGRTIPTVEQHPYPMEEMEVPMTDDKGRKVHPEDAEAREAAKSGGRQRREKSSKPQKEQPQKEQSPKEQPKAKQQPPKKQPAKAREQSAAPQGNKQQKKQPPKSQFAQEPILKPEEDVGDYSDWVRHRASTRPAVRKPYSEANLDELLALPHFASELGYDQIGKTTPRKKSVILPGGKVMDSTARMFMKNRSPEEEEVPEKPVPHESGRPAQGKKNAPAPRPEQTSRKESGRKPEPQAVESARQHSPQPEPAGQTRHQGNRQDRRSRQEKAPLPEKIQQSQPNQSQPKSKHRPHHRRNKGKEGGKKPAPESGKSLVRPYYLSDKKGKN
ncbi:MAG: DEAD/DEAH box helicase [Oscillospiraceae bacterium]|nr:DEAD/DEAH box helicase [Oscillospiraceae bacterium]